MDGLDSTDHILPLEAPAACTLMRNFFLLLSQERHQAHLFGGLPSGLVSQDHARNQSITSNPRSGQAQRQRGDGKPEMSSVPRRRARGICSPQHRTGQAWDNLALTQVSSSVGQCWPGLQCKVRAPAYPAMCSTLTWKRKTPPETEQNAFS